MKQLWDWILGGRAPRPLIVLTDRQTTQLAGEALGLTPGQIKHVRDVWTWHFEAAARPVDERQIRRALTAYAGSGDWRP